VPVIEDYAPIVTRLRQLLVSETRACKREGCTGVVEIKHGKGLGKAKVYCSPACFPTRRWQARNVGNSDHKGNGSAG
jgi:ribosome-binding factor A